MTLGRPLEIFLCHMVPSALISVTGMEYTTSWFIVTQKSTAEQLSILPLSKEEEIKFICAQQEVELEKKRTEVMLMCRNFGIFAYYRKPDISSLTYRDIAGGESIFFAQMWDISLTTKLSWRREFITLIFRFIKITDKRMTLV